jgi:hypothetical protein
MADQMVIGGESADYGLFHRWMLWLLPILLFDFGRRRDLRERIKRPSKLDRRFYRADTGAVFRSHGHQVLCLTS